MLGGVPSTPSQWLYTPIIQQSFYVVNMQDFLVNGVSIGVNATIYNSGQCIVDSGTTGMRMTARV